MDIAQFQHVLTAFADRPADIDLKRGTLLVQIRDDIIEAQVAQRHGDLSVIEEGSEYPAGKWLIQRVARLQMLADRILSQIPEEPSFVNPTGALLDQLEVTAVDENVRVARADECVTEVLGRRPAGTSSVLYLTSDAGEGKTTLIHHVARAQALRYKRKESDWLIVPVSLGGRTFMRFDDVIIGALVNTLRFQLLYYEAFIELVKMGAIVLALDGFEEMFVENAAGDAISSIGNLMDTLGSSGTVLIAARKAFFEYKNLESQARLFDSIDNQSVAFARLSLDRWDRDRFVEYSEKRGVTEGGRIFDDVATKLGEDHPLLTRAVLVRRLLDVAATLKDRDELIARIECDPKDFFRQFVGTIITREAHDKWIDKSGEAARPLLTDEEHYDLLAAVALEMWSCGTELIRGDVLDLVAEAHGESKGKGRAVIRQIVERIKQHALIVKADAKNGHFSFDHQEFYHFFLGEAIGQMITSNDAPALKNAFAQNVLPGLTIDTAAKYAIRKGATPSTLVTSLNQICDKDSRSSHTADNLGGIVMRLIDYAGGRRVLVEGGSFPIDSLLRRRISEVEFRDCYFQSTSLDGASIVNCRFEQCEFERLDVSGLVLANAATIHDCTCRSVVASDAAVFAPDQVDAALTHAGFSVTTTATRPQAGHYEQEDALVVTDRMCRIFLRSTGINETTLRQRLGSQATTFFNEVLPKLEDAGVVQEVAYRGGGKNRRYRLARSLHTIQRAIEDARGSFDRFLDAVQR